METAGDQAEIPMFLLPVKSEKGMKTWSSSEDVRPKHLK